MDLKAAAQSLRESLKLARTPIGICLLENLPAGVKPWTGRAPAGCSFWELAEKEVFATVSRDHDLCSIGQYTHNMELDDTQNRELSTALTVFAQLGYVRDEDIPQIPVLETRPKVVVYGPLDRLPEPPDVVLVFAKADQSLILAEAAQQVEGGVPPAMGRPACAIVPQAMNTGRAALSLGCCGARAYVGALTPETALYALPGRTLGAYLERIQVLAKANATLTQFHTIRKADVAAGKNPTIEQSIAAMSAAGSE